MLRVRVGAAQVEVPGDFAIGVREMGGEWWGGCDGSGIMEATMDVAGTKVRCEQTDGGHQATAVYAEQLVLVGDSQLEGVYRLDSRDEVDDDVEVGRVVSPSEQVTRAGYLPPSPYFFFSAKTVDPDTSCEGEGRRRPCRW